MKLFLAILALAAGFLQAQPAPAEDLIVSRAVLEDPTGALTIADVAGRVTTPAGPSLSIFSTTTVHWLCLHVQAPAHGSKVVLYLRPAYLNDVRLYQADSGNPLTWKTRVTGNRYPFGGRDRASVNLGFVVDVAAPQATYYLRVKTRSPVTLAVEGMEPAEAESKDHQRDLLMMFFFTAMAYMLLWAILSYLLNHQPVVGLFALHQAAYTSFSIVATGYLAPLVPGHFPQLADTANIALYCTINCTAVLFCRELFKPYEPPPRMMRGTTLLLCAFPVLLAAIALGYDSLAININTVLVKITWIYFPVMAFRLRVERTPRRLLLQIVFVSILINNGLSWLASQNARVASVTHLTAIHTLIFNGIVMGGLFAIILQTRSRQMRREAYQSALDLLSVQKKLELEQELKKQAELQAQTDYLTGLFNRRRFVESAEHELERAIRCQRPLTLLMIDIDHFKSINDAHGHAMGDLVLQKVSALMRDALRSVDILGRMGGEEFAATIVETEGSDAIEAAQRVCECVANTPIVLPEAGPVAVTVSIGLTSLNGRDIPFNSLLDEADRAMYLAKKAGRNRLRVCGANREALATHSAQESPKPVGQ